MARHCPYRASFTQASRSQPARPTPTPAPRGTPQAIRGGTRGIRGIVRGGARGSPQANGGRRVCYAVPDRAEVEASDAVITDMVPVCHGSTLVLFDPGSTYYYVSTYFASDLDIMCEPLTEPIYVSTPVDESLVVNQVY